jgi:hypothetical protein
MEAAGSFETLLSARYGISYLHIYIWFSSKVFAVLVSHTLHEGSFSIWDVGAFPCNTGLCPWRNAVTSWGQAAVTYAPFWKLLSWGWYCSQGGDNCAALLMTQGAPLEFQMGWCRIRNLVSSSNVQWLLNFWWRQRILKYLREAYVSTLRIFSVGGQGARKFAYNLPFKLFKTVLACFPYFEGNKMRLSILPCCLCVYSLPQFFLSLCGPCRIRVK